MVISKPRYARISCGSHIIAQIDTKEFPVTMASRLLKKCPGCDSEVGIHGCVKHHEETQMRSRKEIESRMAEEQDFYDEWIEFQPMSNHTVLVLNWVLGGADYLEGGRYPRRNEGE